MKRMPAPSGTGSGRLNLAAASGGGSSATALSANATPPQIGDRVVIGGTGQQGVLRYWGGTSFREGLWAGIELDDESGKNDGTVQGYACCIV
jgi:hypothetical protein